MSDPKGTVQEYAREGLLALLPVYQDAEACTLVYTRTNRYRDPRSTSWLVRLLAQHFWLDLAQLRRHYSRLLGQRHNISLPLDTGLVLLPLKTREAAQEGESTTGYMNLQQVQAVVPATPAAVDQATSSSPAHLPHTPAGGPAVGPGKALSVIRFSTGLMLPSLNTPETMQARLDQGRQVRREFLRRRQGDAPHGGLRFEDMQEIMPPCDCILKNYFLHRFDLAGG